jgi:hydroxymethylglutaryl-CoA reductase
MVENAIGILGLPLGIAQNFVVNGRPVLVPMAIEEPSVIAGASFMAKLAQASGGFTASADEPEMIGQIQLLDVADPVKTEKIILEHKKELLDSLKSLQPQLQEIGGGPRDLVVRHISDSPIGPFLVLHLIYDVRDAMGANMVNTAVENLAPKIEALTGGRAHLRILSNLADRRLARASVTIRTEDLAFEKFSGEQVREGIIEAWAFAAADPYRAVTHNKGIMNGVDAVVLATGNDWRGVEAGAHAYASKSGQYTSLSTWSRDAGGNLNGFLEMPMVAGIFGGSTQVNPTTRACIKILGVKSARELAEIIVSVGLAQNLAALRALATEGIQKGHMALHARQVAISAGARDDQVDRLAAQLVSERAINLDRAVKILAEWNQ